MKSNEGMSLGSVSQSAGVPSDWWSKAQKDIAEQEYRVTWQDTTCLPDIDSAWQAPNRAHDLRTYFTEDGPRVVRRSESEPTWVWGLELVDLSGTGVPPAEEMVTNGNRIEYRRGGLIEWYVNDAKGLEQGFTIERIPPQSPLSQGGKTPCTPLVEGGLGGISSNLVLDLAVRGSLMPGMMAGDETIEFLSEGGVGLIHYGQLVAHDATGKELPARMELVECGGLSASGGLSKAQVSLCNPKLIRLIVDASDADYPVTIDPLATSPAWTAESNQTESYFGMVATAGDVNGDGYSDVIVGAPWYDSGEMDEGRAFIYHGSASGLSAAPDWTAEANQEGAEFGGSAATAGDVNGDGYSDVIIGAYYYDSGQEDEGRAFVYHGSASGLGTTPAWTAESDQEFAQFGWSVSTAGDVNGDGYADVIVAADVYTNDQSGEGRAFVYHGSVSGLSLSPSWTAEGNQDGAWFGNSVSTAGDVNGDGYSEVIVGAPDYTNGQDWEGRAFVYHGSASGLSSSAAWTAEGNQAEAWFAYSVATAGDVNGDGYADVVVGAPYASNGQSEEGRAFVYYGSGSGLGGTPAWTAESDLPGAYFGGSVATAGDVNGDGYAEVVVGAYLYGSGQVHEGGAFMWYGSAGGLGANGTPANAAWATESDQAEAYLGAVATAGDVNGDGYSDVIVGAGLYDNDQVDEGRAFVYHGSPSGLGTSVAWSVETDTIWTGFGYSVAGGDVNGDGYSDVIVGAPYYDVTYFEQGRAFAYYGSASGLSTTPDWMIAGPEKYEGWFGQSVAVLGDVNGDGCSDVAVHDNDRAVMYYGSPGGLSIGPNWVKFRPGSASGPGDVNGDGYADVIFGEQVYYGSASGFSATAAWSPGGGTAAGDVNGDGYADVVVGGQVYHGSASGLSATPAWPPGGGSVVGSGSAAGDVNGDGYSDVIFGAPYYDNGETDEGGAFVYHGSATGLSASPSWTAESDQAEAMFGWSASTAGDVNGDGYSDVFVGALYYDNGQTNEGRLFVYYGSGSGLSAMADWTVEGNRAWACFGQSVSTAGDVNGDGYSDIILGDTEYSNGETGEGRAIVYYGNGETGGGLPVVMGPMQMGANPPFPCVGPMGMTDISTGIMVGMTHRSPFGPGKVSLEVECKPLGTLFDGTGTTFYPDWVNTFSGYVSLWQDISPLTPGTVYHWRARFLYHPATTPYQQHSRWVTPWWNAAEEGDFRTAPTIQEMDWRSLFEFSYHWNETDYSGWCDFTGDGTVDNPDLLELERRWQQ